MPLHRSLTESILLAVRLDRSRSSTAPWRRHSGLAFSCGSWDSAMGLIGHLLAVWGAKIDPQFMDVFARHVKYRPYLDV